MACQVLWFAAAPGTTKGGDGNGDIEGGTVAGLLLLQAQPTPPMPPIPPIPPIPLNGPNEPRPAGGECKETGAGYPAVR